VGKKVNGVLVQGFLYQDQLRVAAELDGSGTLVTLLVYGGRYSPAYVMKGGSAFRVVKNSNGSPVLLVDSSTGAIAQSLGYDEFGVVTMDTAPGFQPVGFAGGIHDPLTGLVRFGARDYDAATGRWTTKDPIRFGGGDGNLYAYVFGDPVNLTDPTGLDVEICSRRVNSPFIPEWIRDLFNMKHSWIRTDTVERGMGTEVTPYSSAGLGTPSLVTDQNADQQSEFGPVTCEPVSERLNVDEECVNNQLTPGRPLGGFAWGNTCNDFAESVVLECSNGGQGPIGDQSGE